MASSPNKPSLFKFALQYWYGSAVLTIGFIIYAYWDIIQLRYMSGFFAGGSTSETTNQLFMAGFRNTLHGGVSTALPILVTLFLSSLVAYTIYNSYKFTIFDLDVNHNYINAAKVHTGRIVAHYIALYTASFVAPLLFWCLYFSAILPWITRLPLGYIFGSSTMTFALVSIACVLGLIVITHTGIVITRLTSKILRKT